MTPVKHDRLRSGRDIANVLRGRRQRAGRLVVLHVRSHRTQGAGPARVAVIASKRVGNAVARNRAKRLMREAARHIPFTAGSDIVLVARPHCAHATSNAVYDEVRRLGADLGTMPFDATPEPDAGQLLGSRGRRDA